MSNAISKVALDAYARRVGEITGFNNATRQDNPSLDIIVGLPGSGKSTFIQQEFNAAANNHVFLQLDVLRESHPSYMASKNNEFKFMEADNHARQSLNDHFTNCLFDRKSMILEYPFTHNELFFGYIDAASDAGFTTNVHIMAENTYVAAFQKHLRFLNEQESFGYGRYITPIEFNTLKEYIPDNLTYFESLKSEGVINKIAIVSSPDHDLCQRSVPSQSPIADFNLIADKLSLPVIRHIDKLTAAIESHSCKKHKLVDYFDLKKAYSIDLLQYLNNTVDLKQFMLDHGGQIDRSKTSHRFPVIRFEGENYVLNERNGFTSGDRRGNLHQFIKEQVHLFPDTHNAPNAYVKALNILKDYYFNNGPSIEIQPRQAPAPRVIDADLAARISQKPYELKAVPPVPDHYLFSQRGLDYSLASDKYFKDTFTILHKPNQPGNYACFHLHENIASPQSPAAIWIRGNGPADEFKKGRFIEGSVKEAALWSSNFDALDQSKPVTIFFMENPIDAMSHYQLNKQSLSNPLYLCSIGSVTDQQLNHALDIHKAMPGSRLVSAFDNDIEGRRFDAKLFIAALKQAPEPVPLTIETFKKDGQVCFHMLNTDREHTGAFIKNLEYFNSHQPPNPFTITDHAAGGKLISCNADTATIDFCFKAMGKLCNMVTGFNIGILKALAKDFNADLLTGPAVSLSHKL